MLKRFLPHQKMGNYDKNFQPSLTFVSTTGTWANPTKLLRPYLTNFLNKLEFL
jgi:hypothetical protein